MTEYKTELQAAWFKVMREKYDTDDTGVRKIMAERQAKGEKKLRASGKPRKGGFNTMTKAELTKAQAKGRLTQREREKKRRIGNPEVGA